MPTAREPAARRASARPRFVPWPEAMRQALYGHGGFFHRPEGPAGHFRTSVHASGLFAEAVAALLVEVDDALGRPPELWLVDVGAGRGELLEQVRQLVDLTAPGLGWADLGERLRLAAVELAERPADLAASIHWSADLPEDVLGLVVANEWLDDVPVDVVEVGPDGPCQVLVEPSTGRESPGGPVGVQAAGWLARWWPLDGAADGDRAEVGLERDQAWARAVASLRSGVAVAVDYGHLRTDRLGGRYAGGTLAGYREGRAVAAVPDGSCDLTAHVAVDSCAAAGEAAGGGAAKVRTVLLPQRDALAGLRVSGALPPVGLAGTDPGAYARALVRASQAAELLDPAGLGGFWWLAQSVGMDLPPSLSVATSGGRQGR